MDMDDDFIGEIEFNLSPEQADLVSRAISVASQDRVATMTSCRSIRLIAIMTWWKAHGRSASSKFARDDTR